MSHVHTQPQNMEVDKNAMASTDFAYAQDNDEGYRVLKRPPLSSQPYQATAMSTPTTTFNQQPSRPQQPQHTNIYTGIQNALQPLYNNNTQAQSQPQPSSYSQYQPPTSYAANTTLQNATPSELVSALMQSYGGSIPQLSQIVGQLQPQAPATQPAHHATSVSISSLFQSGPAPLTPNDGMRQPSYHPRGRGRGRGYRGGTAPHLGRGAPY